MSLWKIWRPLSELWKDMHPQSLGKNPPEGHGPMSTVAMRSLTRSLPVSKEAGTGSLLSVPAESSLATQLSGLGYGPSQLFRSRLLKKTIPTSTTEAFQMLPNSPSLEMVPIHRTTRDRS